MLCITLKEYIASPCSAEQEFIVAGQNVKHECVHLHNPQHTSIAVVIASLKIAICFVQLLGSTGKPLECIIGATAIGPTLNFITETEDVHTPEVAFGTIDVLQVQKCLLYITCKLVDMLTTSKMYALHSPCLWLQLCAAAFPVLYVVDCACYPCSSSLLISKCCCQVTSCMRCLSSHPERPSCIADQRVCTDCAQPHRYSSWAEDLSRRP